MTIPSLLLFVICAAFTSVAHTSDTVVLGQVLSHDWAGVDTECPADSICMHSWTRWELKITKTVSGTPILGRVTVAHLQHTLWQNMSRRETQLFVLAPIEDEVLKKKLKVDYYIKRLSGVRQMYCLDRPPNELGIVADDEFVYSDSSKQQYCFDTSTASDSSQ